jgi:hypothetical protein
MKIVTFDFMRTYIYINEGQESVVGIVTGYGLDGPGIESRLR